MNQIQQLAIVLAGLFALPFVIKLLKLVYLFPLSLYFVATRLFFPNWYLDNRLVCAAIGAVCVLYFVLAWVLRFRRRKQSKQQALEDLLARAKPFRPEMADPHWYENY
ncbi:MAG: hypothetical protein IJ364_00440 [Oscillospiraceae bacterium]|nr:hypothetical protein [Oscillospiraceae bacterium]